MNSARTRPALSRCRCRSVDTWPTLMYSCNYSVTGSDIPSLDPSSSAYWNSADTEFLGTSHSPRLLCAAPCHVPRELLVIRLGLYTSYPCPRNSTSQAHRWHCGPRGHWAAVTLNSNTRIIDHNFVTCGNDRDRHMAWGSNQALPSRSAVPHKQQTFVRWMSHGHVPMNDVERSDCLIRIRRLKPVWAVLSDV